MTINSFIFEATLYLKGMSAEHIYRLLHVHHSCNNNHTQQQKAIQNGEKAGDEETYCLATARYNSHSETCATLFTTHSIRVTSTEWACSVLCNFYHPTTLNRNV